MALGKHNVRVKALSEKIAQALGNALVAPTLAYVPEGSVNPPTAHMRFPGNHHDARRDVREGRRIRGAKLQAPRLSRHRAARRPWRVPQEPDQAVADRLESRVGGIDGRASMRSTSTTGRAQTTLRAGAQAPRATATTRSGPTPGSPTRRSRWRSIRGSCAPRSWPAADTAGPADGVYGDPRRSSAELGQLGVDAIVAATVDAIRRAMAGHDAWKRDVAYHRAPAQIPRTANDVPIAVAHAGVRPLVVLGRAPAWRRPPPRRRIPAGARTIATVPGMPPVVDPTNLYSETAAGKISPAVAAGSAARLRAESAVERRLRDRSGDDSR